MYYGSAGISIWNRARWWRVQYTGLKPYAFVRHRGLLKEDRTLPRRDFENIDDNRMP